MSNFSDVPTAIAAALSAVNGVTGYESRPRAPKVGDAWVKWANAAHTAPGVLEDGWQVAVALADAQDAQREWISTHRWGIMDALADVVFVENMEAGTVNDSPALLINCRE